MMLPLLDLQKSCLTPAHGVHLLGRNHGMHMWRVDSKYLHFAVGKGAYTQDKTTYLCRNLS